ncbi:hypothetical protein FYJ85_14700 [Victivallaceae bacterium BBE-744-WT-12]|uniref:Uncharacterized protein n=1 Tax=Victivallis lenta TaxID=2606640 RepID=A0A844G6U4_9BACT|nr:hypothetical protein [Victivallis lenta]MST98291.1 hypothetical protein [Victivallis lenta]
MKIAYRRNCDSLTDIEYSGFIRRRKPPQNLRSPAQAELRAGHTPAIFIAVERSNLHPSGRERRIDGLCRNPEFIRKGCRIRVKNRVKPNRYRITAAGGFDGKGSGLSVRQHKLRPSPHCVVAGKRAQLINRDNSQFCPDHSKKPFRRLSSFSERNGKIILNCDRDTPLFIYRKLTPIEWFNDQQNASPRRGKQNRRKAETAGNDGKQERNRRKAEIAGNPKIRNVGQEFVSPEPGGTDIYAGHEIHKKYSRSGHKKPDTSLPPQ